MPIGPDAPALLAMPGNLLTPFNTGTVEDTKAEIQRQKADGADFIKIGLVSPTAFYVAIAEAHRVGLSAVGHLQEGVDPAQASRSGFNGIEHLGPGDTVWIGCSTQEAALLKEAAERPAIKAPPFKIPFLERIVMHQLETRLINPAAFDDPVNVQRLQRALDSYDDSKCRSLGAQFIKDTTWQTPTLVRLRTQYLADDPAYQSDPALAYQPKAATKAWRKVLDRFRKLPASMRQTYRVAYQGQLKLTKLFADQGVPMMAGTDGGGVVPGQSLHQEFDELAKAGLSPLKILQMTTLNGAQFLGRTATMGSVEVGKTADLVLLDANPVATVHNLHGISGVVRAGRYYSRADLDRLKQRVVSGDGRF
ncbi:MAG: amidohydrolase family protein [bacterium]|nr:amidohydrolase family protein [bacterium]